jgi:uncharacterized protein (DUF2336 family)
MLDTPKSVEAPSKARELMAKRLSDIVCLPASRIAPQERHIAGDLLVDVLSRAGVEMRVRCAQRIAPLSDAPGHVVRFLARDEIAVARHLLGESLALSDADLIAAARYGAAEHRRLIARRREVSELVCEAIVSYHEPEAIEALLLNRGVQFSQDALDEVVGVSRDHPSLAEPLSRREELRPGQGLTLFWWADRETRRILLQRFAVERTLLHEAATDVFAVAAEEGWRDAVSRKALQFIERRQRNRGAIARSPYESLEDAIDHVSKAALDRSAVEEISYLAGVRPATGAQIVMDVGGEPVAVMCKATGLKRPYLGKLWKAVWRVRGDLPNYDEAYERVEEAYDSLSTDKAQTVLRYWNWSLTSAIGPGRAATELGAGFDLSVATAPERTAHLMYGRSR